MLIVWNPSAIRWPRMALIRCWLVLLLGCGGWWTARAAELAVGDAVPAFSAKDQFGKEFKFAPGLRFLVLGFEMGAAKQANLKLAGLGGGWLEKRGAVYVMDIHTMPAVARLFALPKMRKYPQRIVLAEAEGLLEFIAGRLPDPSHELSACRFEQATLRAAEFAELVKKQDVHRAPLMPAPRSRGA